MASSTASELYGSSGINGTQIFACYCDRVLGHRYLLRLKNFAVPFLPLDPTVLAASPGLSSPSLLNIETILFVFEAT